MKNIFFLLLAAFCLVGCMAETSGPQSPRDISSSAGTNPVSFSLAPPASEMNRCNLHIHKAPEHHGTYCDGQEGLIELHEVYTSCEPTNAPGLSSCVACNDPVLRVEAQVLWPYDGVDMGIIKTSDETVTYRGSTTGPDYDNADNLSPHEVTWSVKTHCAPYDPKLIEDVQLEGVRALVTDKGLLSKIE